MKAIVQDRYGSPDVLRLEDIDTPEIGDDDVLVRVHAAGLDPGVLCQLAAEACAVPVVAGPAEASALGNLLLQARTLGDLPEELTIREVAARSSTLEVFTPTLQST